MISSLVYESTEANSHKDFNADWTNFRLFRHLTNSMHQQMCKQGFLVEIDCWNRKIIKPSIFCHMLRKFEQRYVLQCDLWRKETNNSTSAGKLSKQNSPLVSRVLQTVTLSQVYNCNFFQESNSKSGELASCFRRNTELIVVKASANHSSDLSKTIFSASS